jgi:hypothetical protein
MKRIILCGGILFFSTSSTHAKPPALCKPLSELQKQVENCEQNDYFTEAAILCLESFEGRVKATAALLNLNTNAGAQSQAFQRTKAELEKSRALAAALIAEGTLRFKEIIAYSKNIAFPEDSDNPEIVGGDFKKFLAGSQCYKRTGAVLESVMENMNKNLKNLKAAEASLALAVGEAGARATGLDSGSVPAAAKATKAQGPKRIPSGHQKPGVSDVTGVPESMRKDSKKQ